MPARVRPAGRRRPDALPDRITSGSPPSSGSAEAAEPSSPDAAARAPRRLAARAREHARRAAWRRWTSRAATASSSTSAPSADGVPVLRPRRDARPRPGRRPAVAELDRGRARGASACPTLDGRAGGHPAPRVPRRRAQGRPGARRRSRSWPRDAGPASSARSSRRSSRRRSARCGGLRRRWPRWLNARDLTAATIALGRASSAAAAISAEWHAHRRARRRTRRAPPGLEVAAWTVRRRPTYAPPGAAGRHRDLRRGRGARRLTRGDPGREHGSDDADRADLVVVGAGTIGGWAAYFAGDGRRRPGRRPRARPGRQGREQPGRRHRPGPGRDAGDRRARALVDRLLPPASRPRYGTDSGFRELGYLILAVTEDDERGGPRAGRDAAGRGARRPLADARPRPRPLNPTLAPDGHRGGSFLETRRPHRSAAQRPGVLAGDAARRASSCASGPPFTGLRTERPTAAAVVGVETSDRADRHGARPADRRADAPRGRAAGRACASRPAPPGTRSRSLEPHPAFAVERHADGVRHRRRACTGGSRRAGCCSAGATPTRRRARRARSTGRRTSAMRERLGGLRAAHARARPAQGLGRDDRLHARSPADPRPGAATATATGSTGVRVASAGGHGMMWGPGVARVAADLATRRRGRSWSTSRTSGLDRFDDAGRSRLRDRPDRPAVPTRCGGRRGPADERVAAR